MKMNKRIITIVVALFAIIGTTSAQVGFGVKVGAKINDLRFEQDYYEDTYNTGFTCGLMMEYMFPSTNIGIDASIMYFNVQTEFLEGMNSPNQVSRANYRTHFIDLPINFKWKIGLPVAKNVVTPFLTTGPCFSMIGGARQIAVNNIRCKSVTIDWDFGLGAELFNRVQIGVNYGLGLTNAFETFGYKGRWTDIPGKKNSWTITAAYIF